MNNGIVSSKVRKHKQPIRTGVERQEHTTGIQISSRKTKERPESVYIAQTERERYFSKVRETEHCIENKINKQVWR